MVNNRNSNFNYSQEITELEIKKIYPYDMYVLVRTFPITYPPHNSIVH